VSSSLYRLDNIKLVNRLSFLIGTLAVFIILSSCMYYIIQNWFRIEQIKIQGNTTHITEEQLSYIAKNRLTGTFFTLDIDRLQHEFQRIPWVKSVAVLREFPDTIVVNIDEYDVIARFGSDGLIAGDGKVFDGADDSTTLPTFVAQQQQIGQLLDDYRSLKPLLAQKNLTLTKLELNGGGITKIIFSNNMQVVICNVDISDSLKTLARYWDKLYTINPNLSYINMCYKNAVAINMGQKNEK
jgi:cell division protein FtsQ